MKKLALVTVILALAMASTQCASPKPQRRPIIDVHLHALSADRFGPPGLPNPATGQPSAATTNEAVREHSLAALERYNIVQAITSGTLPFVEAWRTQAPERIIPAVTLLPEEGLPPVEELRSAFQNGRFAVLGEVGAQYFGLTLASPELAAYLALAEELDIPVALHTGFGPPGVSYQPEPCCPGFRAALGNPLLIEEALVRHPRLRLYLMHAGYPFVEETIALLHAHPQVYADLSVINWILDREEFHQFLRRLMLHASDGCELPKRLMFGSDQMIWPEAIGMAIEGIESARFLTEEQKRDIFCRNAARFLRLDPAICN